MRQTASALLWCSLSLALGCDAESANGSVSKAVAVADGEDAGEGNPAEQDEDTEDDGETIGVDDLNCPEGGETGPIAVAFACDEIVVVTCKDLSNVVLQYEDGSRQRYEGLNGHENTFAGSGEHEGKVIVGVWVKSGANHSGDGPGYGERFDAPEDSCDPGDGPDDPAPPEDEDPPAEDPPADDGPVVV